MSDANKNLGTGNGRFGRKPLATLARISSMAATAGQEEVQLPTSNEIDDLISYLSIAKAMGGMTLRQVDAFWDLNRQLMEAHAELREFYDARPAWDDAPCPYPAPTPDATAINWLEGLDPAGYATVAEAAYAQFKDELASSADQEAGHRPR